MFPELGDLNRWMGSSGRFAAFGLVLSLLAACQPPPASVQVSGEYTGACDASAAAAIDEERFVAASDEDNRLRVYLRKTPGPPVTLFGLASLLNLDSKHLETDIEGAAKLGTNIFWITSHGRDKDGKERPARQRLFATAFESEADQLRMRLVGRPYEGLLEDLLAAPDLQRFRLEEASKRSGKSRRGLNIEGLCSTEQGQLLIAFRSPTPDSRALLVPLANPTQVLEGHPAKLGKPILLDLRGRGIRDIARARDRFVIVGGAPDGGAKYAQVFAWDGKSARPELLRDLSHLDFNPEAVVLSPDGALEAIQILSDDGSRSILGKDCKDTKDETARTFRSLWIKQDQP